MRQAVLAALLIPSLAFAQSATVYDYNTVSTAVNTNNNVQSGTVTNNNNNVNTSSSTTLNTNNNVQSGTLTNINQSTSTSTNVNVNSGTLNYNNTSTSTNVNQSSSVDTSTSTVNQTVNQRVTQDTSNTNVNQNSSTSYSASDSSQRIDQHVYSPPPSAIAPSMMSYSQDVCTSGASGAVQTQILGLSFGKPVRDLTCERMKLARTLWDMGMKVAGVSLLCQDPRVFNAMLMAGTPCPFNGEIGAKATQLWIDNPSRKPKR